MMTEIRQVKQEHVTCKGWVSEATVKMIDICTLGGLEGSTPIMETFEKLLVIK